MWQSKYWAMNLTEESSEGGIEQMHWMMNNNKCDVIRKRWISDSNLRHYDLRGWQKELIFRVAREFCVVARWLLTMVTVLECFWNIKTFSFLVVIITLLKAYKNVSYNGLILLNEHWLLYCKSVKLYSFLVVMVTIFKGSENISHNSLLTLFSPKL